VHPAVEKLQTEAPDGLSQVEIRWSCRSSGDFGFASTLMTAVQLKPIVALSFTSQEAERLSQFGAQLGMAECRRSFGRECFNLRHSRPRVAYRKAQLHSRRSMNLQPKLVKMGPFCLTLTAYVQEV